ncbi:type II toxin-antitoxin system VapC family toxin [Silvibacterium dinghuense]|uniref:PIN domain-containing protein n=1 Tax=Silvibacterium dinghuense TaxID=1560006 RepID=A0A4Q1SB97_9BACT|nr:type II toxin-antitoxin system VapC family toxin [Silvibacterium dinghuense]RXS94414.1 PIN domain-containing protein [Silvibacterium dinghuense]GGH16270.1 hypothetical protein GCM10011586_37970 [Silvibacterium dinghuense]
MIRVYWDTMLFAYMLEAHPEYGPRMREVYGVLARRGARICTSIFTVGEVLTYPKKLQDEGRVRMLMRYFEDSGDVEVLPFSMRTAKSYAAIRAVHRVLPADAVHLASAAELEVDMFMTNDRKLQGLQVEGIKFITGMDGRLL